MEVVSWELFLVAVVPESNEGKGDGTKEQKQSNMPIDKMNEKDVSVNF